MAAFCENCGLEHGKAQDGCDCGSTIGEREGHNDLSALRIASRVAGVLLFTSAVVLAGQSIFASLNVVPRELSVPIPQRSNLSSPTIQTLPKGFVGRWYLIYPGGHHPVAEDGTPIRYQYAEVLSDGNINMHTVFPDQDFSELAPTRKLARPNFISLTQIGTTTLGYKLTVTE